MALTLYFHPFASYCQKALIALYENATPFTPVEIDLGDAGHRARLEVLWPFARFPVLVDEANGTVLPESTIIIEYLSTHYPGPFAAIPAEPEAALEARLWERFFDGYVMTPMQKIVLDRLRPEGAKDPLGVDEARATLALAYRLLDERMAARSWAAAEAFTMADCAAAPSLFYADWVHPFHAGHPALAGYFDRLLARPSFARVVEEARPYRQLFPGGPPAD